MRVSASYAPVEGALDVLLAAKQYDLGNPRQWRALAPRGAAGPAARPRPRPAVSLRVRVQPGSDPISGNRHQPTEVVRAGGDRGWPRRPPEPAPQKYLARGAQDRLWARTLSLVVAR
ncbi:hypothetical protein ACQPZQ_03905 [Pseudonocardia sp. CA-142604]|uniref:hypothetical protein n=1 Tax=Pseudonocardia sp. CA-142604 TaxID=3240024 RepID=UPI003D921F58